MTDHARNCRTILQMVGWLMIFRCGFYVFYLMVTSCSSPPGAEQSAKDAPLSIPIPLPESLLELAGLIGTWTNVDPKTDHLTRVEIMRTDSSAQLLIRMWASCQPEDCFWGVNTSARTIEEPTDTKTPELFLEWELRSSVSSQTVRLIRKDLLEINTHTQSLGADFDFDVTDRFRRTGEIMKTETIRRTQ